MSYKETPEDLSRKYSHSFLTYKNELVLIGEFMYRDNVIQVTFMYKKSDKWEFDKWDSEVFIEPKIPNGFYNACDPETKRPMAYVFNRKPMRQYRRGVCRDNAELLPISALIMQHLGLYPHTADNNLESFSPVEHLLNPIYPVSPAHAVEQVKVSGTVALCPEFGLVLDPSQPEGVLIINRNNHFIGELVGKEFRIKFKPFLQEAQDVVRKRRLDLVVCEV